MEAYTKLMKGIKILFQLLVCGLPLFLCSCVSIGNNFNYKNTSALKLNELTLAEATNLFNKPYQVVTKTTSDGNFIINYYPHAVVGPFGSVQSRILMLEFRNQKLNSYEYLSSFDEDKTTVDTSKVQALKDEKADQAQVIAAMGNPEGKALCPSVVEDFKDKCKNGGEIWYWGSLRKDGGDLQEAFVIFGANNRVVDVETDASHRERLHPTPW